ncbi:DUF2158 domain-containing protein [Ramlibacter sp. USB13]|uniref:DUF2158 domain-containing protein n=1 Tax=Ramlibacter cellulosilyticus TaxID=2764187 RepID=A0A923MPJ3_9BURK|nr:DUF2158 domain-containing protein [Ramlibacter cellulosilyticus]MBC5781492.1 DUF2158 domain-containing protein [Ramlibacter cellulosilyticus]
MQYDHGFKAGDQVRLKAGGPTMSVELLVGNLLLCAWVDPAGRSRRGTFSWHQLQSMDAPLWLDALQRLSARWSVVAATH